MEIAPGATAVRKLPVWVVAICLILAFRGALLVQQAVVFAGLKSAGCSATVSTGLSTKVTGFDGCDGSAATAAAVVGVFGALLVAVPLLLWFRRIDARRDDAVSLTTRQRTVGTFAYLLALAAVAECVAGAVVLTVLDHGEGAEAVARGVPLLALVLAGLALVALAYPTLRSTARVFVVDLVGHDPAHVRLMEKAVLVKLTFGVAVIAGMRLLFG